MQLPSPLRIGKRLDGYSNDGLHVCLGCPRRRPEVLKESWTLFLQHHQFFRVGAHHPGLAHYPPTVVEEVEGRHEDKEEERGRELAGGLILRHCDTTGRISEHFYCRIALNDTARSD